MTIAGTKHLPIDKGWAWIVMISVMLSTFLEMGLYKSFGIFFVEYIEKFGSDASTTSLISGLYLGVFSFASLPILSVGMRKFSCRVAVMTGGTLLSLGYLLSSLATSIGTMFLAQGLITGLGSACIHGPSLLVLGQYFEKRRGVANCMAISFGSLGSLVLPLLFHLLVITYDLNGALLVTSGIILHIVFAGSLLRPLTFYSWTKQKYVSENTDNQPLVCAQKDTKSNNDTLHSNGAPVFNHPQNGTVHSLSLHDVSSTILAHNENYAIKCKSMSTLDDIQQSNIKHVQISKNFESIRCDIDLISSSYADIFLKTTQKSSESNFSCVTKLRKILSPLRNRSFVLLVIAFNLGQFSCGLGHIYVPPYAKDQGLDTSQAAVLVSIIGSANFIGRIIVGLIADFKCIKKMMVITVALCLTGISMLFVHLFINYTSFIIFSIIFGLFSGTLVGLYSTVCVECIGLEEFGKGLGILTSSQGIILGVAAPLLGLLRDVTGTYHASFYLMGATALLGSLVLVFVRKPAEMTENLT